MVKSLFGIEFLWRHRVANTAMGYRHFLYGVAYYSLFFGFSYCPEN